MGGPNWNSTLDERAYWRHLVNAVERLCAQAMSGSAVRGGDAACAQIALGNLVRLIVQR